MATTAPQQEIPAAIYFNFPEKGPTQAPVVDINPRFSRWIKDVAALLLLLMRVTSTDGYLGHNKIPEIFIELGLRYTNSQGLVCETPPVRYTLARIVQVGAGVPESERYSMTMHFAENPTDDFLSRKGVFVWFNKDESGCSWRMTIQRDDTTTEASPLFCTDSDGLSLMTTVNPVPGTPSGTPITEVKVLMRIVA